MATMVWDQKPVVDYLMQHGTSFARIKTPRGWPAKLRSRYSHYLLGKCFRNSLYVSLRSNNSLYYCEGYAKVGRGPWTPHAWCAYKEVGDQPPMWAVDLTWPWLHKKHNMENIMYSGVAFEPLFAYEFIFYIKLHYGEASTSVLKYVDHLPQFTNGLY